MASCLLKHGREGVRNKIKNQRRDGVALSEATFVAKEIPDLFVNRHRGLSSRDKLHDAMNKACLKTLFEENFPYKHPVYMVIGLLNVELKQNRFLLGSFKLMNNFLEGDGDG